MANQFLEVVDGFVFRSPESAKQAKKEVDGIRYIKKELDMENPEAVLQVYNQILKERLFKTSVGYHFLRELQEYLTCSGAISNDDIRPLDVHTIIALEEVYGNNPKEEKLRSRLQSSVILNGILGLLVVAMLLLMYFSDTPTIINYENKIIDKYEHWQKELEEREEALDKLEEELNVQP